MNYAQSLVKAKAIKIPDLNPVFWCDMSELQKLACKLRRKKVLTVCYAKNGIQKTDHCICIEEAEILNRRLSGLEYTVYHWKLEVLLPPEVIRMNLGSQSVTKFIGLLTGASLFSDRFLVNTNERGMPTGIIKDRKLNVVFRCEPDEISYLECHGKRNCAA